MCQTCFQPQVVIYQGLSEVEYGCKACPVIHQERMFVAGDTVKPGEMIYSVSANPTAAYPTSWAPPTVNANSWTDLDSIFISQKTNLPFRVEDKINGTVVEVVVVLKEVKK